MATDLATQLTVSTPGCANIAGTAGSPLNVWNAETNFSIKGTNPAPDSTKDSAATSAGNIRRSSPDARYAGLNSATKNIGHRAASGRGASNMQWNMNIARKRAVTAVSSTSRQVECSRYCSDECFKGQRNAKVRERKAPRPLVSSWCENCGISFQSKTGARFCTASCRSTFDRRKKGNYELGSHRRRAEYYGCEYDETVTRVAILIRDNWTCGICGDSIPQGVAYPSREYGSLDHIIPMSKQGGHTQENAQAAHLGCNMLKHASMPEEMPTAEL